MAILIANIGTSDLSVKLKDFDYFLPIGFDRDEPNVSDEILSPDEQALWDRNTRDEFIIDELCKELGVECKTRDNGKKSYSFRTLTEKLFSAYQQDPEDWQGRIKPGRIWGILNTAIHQFSVNKINLFVTDQPSQHQQDTCYLFEILKKWAEVELGGEIIFLKRMIPQDVSPVKADQLLNIYYQFFVDQVDPGETVLVSIKGGTQPMQTALRLQSITADIPKLLFIDPILSKRNVLHGQPSTCVLTSYWQYQRTQKYRIVMQLLERFDFAGACKILKDWQSILSFQIKQNILSKPQLRSSRKIVEAAISGLEVADSLMNLDLDAARESAQEMDLDPTSDLDACIRQAIAEYSTLLNLYAHCKIYNQNQQVSHFLSRMSSCCEEVLNEVIKQLGGNKYLKPATVGSRIEIQEIKRLLPNDQFSLLESLDYDRESKYAKIVYRASKVNFLAILLAIRKNVGKDEDQEDNSLSLLLSQIDSLQFWIHRRNEMIHNSQGFSSKRILELNGEATKEGACLFENILQVLSEILMSPLLKLPNTHKHRFITGSDLYPYTDLTNWVREKLLLDMRTR
ncbi:MAG: hypothetical protein Q6L68_06530 [Thermostichus sp. DG02_5_bins_236]